MWPDNEGKAENLTFQILPTLDAVIKIAPFWGGTMKAERGPYWLQNGRRDGCHFCLRLLLALPYLNTHARWHPPLIYTAAPQLF